MEDIRELGPNQAACEQSGQPLHKLTGRLLQKLAWRIFPLPKSSNECVAALPALVKLSHEPIGVTLLSVLSESCYDFMS